MRNRRKMIWRKRSRMRRTISNVGKKISRNKRLGATVKARHRFAKGYPETPREDLRKRFRTRFTLKEIKKRSKEHSRS